MAELKKVRIDKWLWSVRIFKSRTAATKACDDGKVKLEGDSLKASKQIEADISLVVRVNHKVRTIKVLKLIEKRVGAAIAETCYEDLTPPEELEPVHRSAFIQVGKRERGAGRPTKKERRQIDKYRGDL